MIQATVKNISQIKKSIDNAKRDEAKALQTAVKVEAFRLRNLLKQEIRSGAPGGEHFEPLTFMARRRGKGFKANKPLQRLALAVRYNVERKDPLTVKVGWTGPQVSQSWKRIAERQQEGFTSNVTERRRRFFMYRGAELSERSRNRKYLFLRDATKKLTTPDRPIIEPFWRAHQLEAWRNIRSNFKRKLKGERI